MEYQFFTFDGIPSEYYNIYITNGGEDLTYPSQPAFENQLVSPLYQGANYLTGVNKKERIFNFNCWIASVTDDIVRSINNWLSVDRVGLLSIAYNPNFSYKVKISSISDWKHMAINTDNTYNFEFQLSFITVDDAAAISNTIYTNPTFPGANPNGFPLGYTTGGSIYLYNTYGLPFYLNLAIASGTATFTVSKAVVSASGIPTSTEHYKYTGYNTAVAYTLDTKYGFCLTPTRTLIEDTAATVLNLGPMPIESNIKSVIGTVGAGTTITFLPALTLDVNMRLYPANKESNTFYTNTTYTNMIADLGLVVGDKIIINYIYPTKITLTAGVIYSFQFRDTF
jgi:hypothetical protein